MYSMEWPAAPELVYCPVGQCTGITLGYRRVTGSITQEGEVGYFA